MSGFAAYPRATTWLYSQLTTPGQITGVLDAYEDSAPEGVTDAASIWIEFEIQQPGADVAEIAAQRIWTEFVFLVRAVARTRSTVGLQAIADEIDNRLHRKGGTTTDGRVLSCTRTEPHSEYQESWVKQGVEYRALGGFFNVIVQPLN